MPVEGNGGNIYEIENAWPVKTVHPRCTGRIETLDERSRRSARLTLVTATPRCMDWHEGDVDPDEW
jgi:hypothetical protein